jgi:putative nucleotidyltransferase with HDIG domain
MSEAPPYPAVTAAQPPVSVLFVDDEANIRTGLRRMLHGMRGLWTMRFADGGDEALEMMRAAPADVVVSDMRMPGMNGQQLLAAIEQAFPRTVRIVLSGQSDQEAALRAAGGAHIFLSKPCDADRLVGAVTRAWRLRAMYGDPRIAHAVAGLPRLPRLPDTYHQLVAALPSPDMSADRLTRIISQDGELLAGTLELANVAPTIDGRELTTLSELLRQHGTAAVHGMVLTAALLRELGDPALRRESLDHAMTAALLARGIAHEMGLSANEISAAFSAGLLHDLGLLLFAGLLPEPPAKLVDELRHGSDKICDLERQVVGATHAEVGAYLLASLGLPDVVVEAVAYHHDPAASGIEKPGVIAAVHAASAIVDCDTPDEAFLDRLGLRQLVERWQAQDGSAAASLPAIGPTASADSN